MEIKPQYRQKTIRSFVIRSGRMTDAQKASYEKHWQQYGLDLGAGELDDQNVFGRKASRIIEIGFGMGDSLFQMCTRDSESNYIGIEVHPPGVGRLMNQAADAGLENLRVYLADAKDVMAECIADNSVDRIQIYFPDPWHKKKHNKRRLVQPEFIDHLTKKLVKGGHIHLATDWEPYAEQMLEVMEADSHYRNEAGAGQYIERPAWRPETKFERRGQKLGHGVWDLLYARI
jgi:tRNA (guanine-N7-)-methyltransferase